MRKLWVDDIRTPPNAAEWVWARTVAEAKELLENETFEECSLDHDMGLQEYDPSIPDAHRLRAENYDEIPSGSDLAKWMAETGNVPPVITVHSYNPWGAENMVRLLEVCEGVTQCVYIPFGTRR